MTIKPRRPQTRARVQDEDADLPSPNDVTHPLNMRFQYDWRHRLACEVVDDGMPVPPDTDAITLRIIKAMRRSSRCKTESDEAEFAKAYPIQAGVFELLTHKESVDLCTLSGYTLDQMVRRFRVSRDVVVAYEAEHFDARSRIEDVCWVAQTIFPGLIDGKIYSNCYGLRRIFGYLLGPDFVEDSRDFTWTLSPPPLHRRAIQVATLMQTIPGPQLRTIRTPNVPIPREERMARKGRLFEMFDRVEQWVRNGGREAILDRVTRLRRSIPEFAQGQDTPQ